MTRGFMDTDTISYSLQGVDELLAKLDSISYDLRRKGGRSALRKAAMVVVKEAQANAARIDNPKQVGRSVKTLLYGGLQSVIKRLVI